METRHEIDAAVLADGYAAPSRRRADADPAGHDQPARRADGPKPLLAGDTVTNAM